MICLWMPGQLKSSKDLTLFDIVYVWGENPDHCGVHAELGQSEVQTAHELYHRSGPAEFLGIYK